MRRIFISTLLEKVDLIDGKLANYLDYPIASNPDVSSIELLMELRDYQFELVELRHESYVQLLESYILSLSSEGKLAESPGVNYLSYDRTRIDIGY